MAARTCDICGAKLGFMKFHYLEGALCKQCYQIVSNNCTRTIVQMSHDEVTEAYESRKDSFTPSVEFRASIKVGDLLLVDEKRRIVCLPHNRRIVKDLRDPEFIAWKDIRACTFETRPMMTEGKLGELANSKDDEAVISRLTIRIKTDARKEPYEIVVLDSAVRAKSYAFQQSYGMALRALDVLRDIQNSSAAKN